MFSKFFTKKNKRIFLVLSLLCGQALFLSAPLQGTQETENSALFQPFTLQKLKALHLWGNVSTDLFVFATTFIALMRSLSLNLLFLKMGKGLWLLIKRSILITWTTAFILSMILRTILLSSIKAKEEKGEKYRKAIMKKALVRDLVLLSSALVIAGIFEWLSYVGKIKWFHWTQEKNKNYGLIGSFFADSKTVLVSKYKSGYAFFSIFSMLGAVAHIIAMGVKYLPRKKPKK